MLQDGAFAFRNALCYAATGQPARLAGFFHRRTTHVSELLARTLRVLLACCALQRSCPAYGCLLRTAATVYALAVCLVEQVQTIGSERKENLLTGHHVLARIGAPLDALIAPLTHDPQVCTGRFNQ